MALAEKTPWVPEDSFGDRLLRLRRALGLTAEEIAARCDLNRATWSTWENGASPRNMGQVVGKIHAATGADREWLMWGTPTLGAAKGAEVRFAGQRAA